MNSSEAHIWHHNSSCRYVMDHTKNIWIIAQWQMLGLRRNSCNGYVINYMYSSYQNVMNYSRNSKQSKKPCEKYIPNMASSWSHDFSDNKCHWDEQKVRNVPFLIINNLNELSLTNIYTFLLCFVLISLCPSTPFPHVAPIVLSVPPQPWLQLPLGCKGHSPDSKVHEANMGTI